MYTTVRRFWRSFDCGGIAGGIACVDGINLSISEMHFSTRSNDILSVQFDLAMYPVLFTLFIAKLNKIYRV